MALEMQNWNASLHDKDELFRLIAKQISASLRKYYMPRVYVVIIDAEGTIHYIDTPAFDELLYFIHDFTKNNFHLMDVGEHSIPFGGINLAFFKVSEKAMVILHTKKGRCGQLLSYKAIMFDWAKKIDELLSDVKEKEPQSIPESKDVAEPQEKPIKKQFKPVERIPLLTKPLTGKEKFSLEVVTVLQYCDGCHSIKEIAEMTGYPRLKVDMVVREYQKKKWLKLMRMM